ncbi:MAG: hypothetical protein FJ143_16395 [Deltaproteobacteria bacterium]|nr:hypothetical protein [Deltaproteobacteria bacterium]
MLSAARGEAAVRELIPWAKEVVRRADPTIDVDVMFEEDSNTFIFRLGKAARVLIFRLSASQVYTDGREAECEKTLNRKINDLRNLL